MAKNFSQMMKCELKSQHKRLSDFESENDNLEDEKYQDDGRKSSHSPKFFDESS